jgi:hypothetical protein
MFSVGGPAGGQASRKQVESANGLDPCWLTELDGWRSYFLTPRGKGRKARKEDLMLPLSFSPFATSASFATLR